jgi:2-iminobutanoate/2-iminopropanoate deaminase
MSKQIVNNVPGAVPPLPILCKSSTRHVVCLVLPVTYLILTAQAVISKGHVYVSGSIGCDEKYNIIGGIHEQTVRHPAL